MRERERERREGRGVREGEREGREGRERGVRIEGSVS